MIPYGKQTINEDDIEEVVAVLKSDWLTQGPIVEEFEKKLAEYCGVKFAVVVANGTAALHAAYFAVGLKKGDEFITSSITFAATANAGIWQGGRPVFVDVDKITGNIDPELIEEKITPRTRVLVPVDYTGRPADLDEIKKIAEKYNLVIIEDACQALGAQYKNNKVGSVSDLSVFSFHPVKSITTGEGGAVLTNNEMYYRKMKMFVTHGITKKNLKNISPGDWYYEMQELGMNYRLTDFQSALGISQLRKLDGFLKRRRGIAEAYEEALNGLKNIVLPMRDSEDSKSSWHLFVINLTGDMLNRRSEIFKKLREANIGVQVHHIPVYLHPYYQDMGYKKGLCPLAEIFYETAISLPIYPSLNVTEQKYIIETIKKILA